MRGAQLIKGGLTIDNGLDLPIDQYKGVNRR
jgi:hypothetical protein